MFAAPYLILFFISLTLQLIAIKKENDRCKKWGYISGAFCGLYIVFMIWVGVGFGEGSSGSYMVTVNGRRLYGGFSAMSPIVVLAFMIIPLLSYSPLWIATLLTNYIFSKPNFTHAPGYPQKSNPKKTIETIFTKIGASFLYLLVGSLPLGLLLDGMKYYDSFTAYLNGSFTHFAICGLLVAIWLLVPIKLFVTLVMYVMYSFFHCKHSK